MSLELHTKLEIDRALLDLKNFHAWAGMEVSDQSQADICAERLTILAAHRKQIEAQRTRVLKPLKEATKAFEEMVREALRPLNAIDALLRNRLSTFMDARQRELEAAARKKREADLAAEKAKAVEAMNLAVETGSEAATAEALQRNENVIRLADKPVEVRQTVRLEGGGTVAQTLVWEWRISDPTAIPREYLVVDEKKLNAMAKSYGKNPVEVPGITFEQKTRLSVAS